MEWVCFKVAMVIGELVTVLFILIFCEEYYFYWLRFIIDWVFIVVEFLVFVGDVDVWVFDGLIDGIGLFLVEIVLWIDLIVGVLWIGWLVVFLFVVVGFVIWYLDDIVLSDLWVVIMWGGA